MSLFDMLNSSQNEDESATCSRTISFTEGLIDTLENSMFQDSALSDTEHCTEKEVFLSGFL